MNYFDLKNICRQIDAQKLKVQEVREEAYKTTPTISDTRGVGTTQDKLGATVCRIDEEKNKQKALELKLEQEILRIPDWYIRKAITGKLKYKWSWKKVAITIGGNNTPDSVRMMCTRYFW